MNYVLLNQFQGKPYLSFIGENCHTYGTYFYCVKPEDESKIPEIKALEMLNPGRENVLESLPRDELPYDDQWTINKLVQLLETEGDSYFILYADIDYKRAVDNYTWSSLGIDKDTPVYSIIRMDP